MTREAKITHCDTDLVSVDHKMLAAVTRQGAKLLPNHAACVVH